MLCYFGGREAFKFQGAARGGRVVFCWHRWWKEKGHTGHGGRLFAVGRAGARTTLREWRKKVDLVRSSLSKC